MSIRVLLSRVALAGALLLAAQPLVASSKPRHTALLLLLDRSGSMRQSDPACVRGAAAELLLDQLSEGDLVWAAEFGGQVYPLTGGFVAVRRDTRADLARRVGSCGSADRFTDIFRALDAALAAIQSMDSSRRDAFDTQVLLLTDGKHEPEVPSTEVEVRIKLRELTSEKVHATVNALGLGPGADPGFLNDVQELGKGEVQRASNARDLVASFLSFARLLGRRWLIYDDRVASKEVPPALPEWVEEWQEVFVPEQGAFAAEDWENRTHYGVRRGHLPIQPPPGVPGPGRLIIDGTGDLDLQVTLPAWVASGLPFECAARVQPRNGRSLGLPRFLDGAYVSLKLGAAVTERLQGDRGTFRSRCLIGGVDADVTLDWSAQLRSGAAVSEPPSQTGMFLAVARPLLVEGEGFFSGLVRGTLALPTKLVVRNVTETALSGEVEVDGQRTALTAPARAQANESPTTELEVNVERPTAFVRRVPVALVVAALPHPLPLGDIVLRPRWLASLLLSSVLIALVATLVLPRRSASGSIVGIRAVRTGSDLPDLAAVGTVMDDGAVRFQGDVPSPLNQPGSFRAFSGIWRHGVVFEPADWSSPEFTSGSRPFGKRRYLLRRAASWRTVYKDLEVSYTFTRRT